MSIIHRIKLIIPKLTWKLSFIRKTFEYAKRLRKVTEVREKIKQLERIVVIAGRKEDVQARRQVALSKAQIDILRWVLGE